MASVSYSTLQTADVCLLERIYLMERIEELITTPTALVTINISKTPLTE